MSNIEQFRTAVIAAGAEARCIERGRPGGAERLVINTLGGLITKKIPLKGVQVEVVSSNGEVIAKPINGGKTNPLCAGALNKGLDPTENVNSLGAHKNSLVPRVLKRL